MPTDLMRSYEAAFERRAIGDRHTVSLASELRYGLPDRPQEWHWNFQLMLIHVPEQADVVFAHL
jgi:hypothetical protein